MNPLTDLHLALASGGHRSDFSDYQYEDRDWEHWRATKEDKRITKTRQHTEYDLRVEAMFPQTWSSTALGFGGVGGQAITDAYTTIISSKRNGEHCVYFGGRFAYRITRPNEEFFKDMAKRYMLPCSSARKYETRT